MISAKKEVVVAEFHRSKYKTATLGLGTGSYYDRNKKTYDLCPECQAKYGLIDEEGQINSVSEPTTAEKLFEIIAQVVAEVANE